MIDIDSTICEVFGRKKRGAAYGYTKVLGYHPILATRADTGEVLHARMRKGSANTARGVRRFCDELILERKVLRLVFRPSAPPSVDSRTDEWSTDRPVLRPAGPAVVARRSRLPPPPDELVLRGQCRSEQPLGASDLRRLPVRPECAAFADKHQDQGVLAWYAPAGAQGAVYAPCRPAQTGSR